ncbi:MAG: hypothetical protein N4A49_11455 [Marinifilaceae bacterium]|jgi:hypothetical protein|nr:hypothetical protein [Marinifilaceae bacterium]
MNKLTYTLALAFLLLFSACDNENLDNLLSFDFDSKVEEISKGQSPISTNEILNKELKITNWYVDYFHNNAKIGNWNDYNENITQSQKSKVYSFGAEKFNIWLNQNIINSSPYAIDKLDLVINKLRCIIKKDANNLYIYYNDKNKDIIATTFGVSLDNDFGKSLSPEGDVNAIGTIVLSVGDNINIESEMQINSFDLVNKFAYRKSIQNQVYESISLTSSNNTYKLSNNNSSLNIELNNNIDLSNIALERNKTLFNAFLTGSTFEFKNHELKISKIAHEDGSGNSYLVFGKLVQADQDVKFYYNAQSGKEHWLIAPENNPVNNNAVNLVNNFVQRRSIDNQVFETIIPTNDSYTFRLYNNQSQKDMIITDQDLDLSNISSERVRNLFGAFISKQNFIFKGVSLAIDKISHEDGSGYSFLVFGKAYGSSKLLKFYYNTMSGKEHWLIAPDSNPVSMNSAATMVNKFVNRSEINNHIFETMELNSDKYIFKLSNNNTINLVTISDQDLNISALSSDRVKNLFSAFINRLSFNFKSHDLLIHKISHEDGSGNSFLVFAESVSTHQQLKFYYNTMSGKEHWLIAPTNN